ncbi:receptor-type tyrosine-protein phosphatase N2-like [Neophocaena asiaeorientalis asiaeorientalis]|uniref:Receptor-type tyrosine-protein phosphatase N2-like n=1 Tax=Neophocaena asiaeorientalis asiaeorientalis TaxID=1706337 RepID=A0A341AY51_NEOAA|nr:receptor-type tyrosine-protein phosphatase N2-like [Neophocaena asiaeorientalis asiaeorientalis]
MKGRKAEKKEKAKARAAALHQCLLHPQTHSRRVARSHRLQRARCPRQPPSSPARPLPPRPPALGSSGPAKSADSGPWSAPGSLPAWGQGRCGAQWSSANRPSLDECERKCEAVKVCAQEGHGSSPLFSSLGGAARTQLSTPRLAPETGGEEKGGRDWEREVRKPGPVEGEGPKTAVRPRDPRSERCRGRVLTRDARSLLPDRARCRGPSLTRCSPSPASPDPSPGCGRTTATPSLRGSSGPGGGELDGTVENPGQGKVQAPLPASLEGPCAFTASHLDPSDNRATLVPLTQRDPAPGPDPAQVLSPPRAGDRPVPAPPSLPPLADLLSSSEPRIQKSKPKLLPHQAEREDSTKFIVLTLVSIVAIVAVLLASGVIYCLRHSSRYRLKEKLSGPGGDTDPDATSAYQELCRQRMAARPSERPETAHTSRVSSVSSQFSDGPMPSPSARGSTSSWSEEPVQPNMDISTGHMVLAYMEDHLKNKNRLEKEWEALCAYQAEPDSSLVAQREENVTKNRCPAVLTYDHSRIRLKSENSHGSSDYINASPIMDHDPRKPAYIATQGPLPATVADFWQMVWESGCVVIVMLTPLSENGVRQCYHYWPDEGSNLYHVYEVHLVSEHIWCEDFLVRSFYLKNLQTNETRTVTQFHFLSWYDQGVPASTRSLLDFRRKVNKCYRGRSCPIIVHCSDGAGRSGTYILIDMVLNKMAKGAKEIDIAATLEHLRDQRPRMVQTKEQFEFALTAVAEEVNAILKAFPQ